MNSPRFILMLHDDWELNGDGSGDIQRLMFEPARKLLAIVERFGARYTFFAEVMQQLAMKRSGDCGQVGYACEWEDLMREAIRRGHDVQLHLHPQWLDASFAAGRWKVGRSNWRIATLPEDQIHQLLLAGKQYLESLLRPERSSYRVVAFRAGGWMAQPSGPLISALRRAGLLADCSVVPGKQLSYVDGGTTDYSRVPSRVLPWWVAADDVARCGPSSTGIVELPTYSEEFRMPLSIHLLRRNLRSAPYYASVVKRRRGHADEREFGLRKSDHAKGTFGRFFARRSTYCSFGYIHHQTLMRMVRRAAREASRQGASEAPLVMLTHSKSFHSYSNFQTLLKRLSSQPDIMFSRTQDYVERLVSGGVQHLPLSAPAD